MAGYSGLRLVQPEFTSSLWSTMTTIIPISLIGFFAINHFNYWIQTGNPVGIGLAVQEMVIVSLFLIRRKSDTSLNTFPAWSATLIATLGVMLVVPGGHVLFDAAPVFTVVQAIGAVLVTTSALSLGRSFGLVAANRGVKTSGAYGLVRHPIYASYLIGYLGYFLASISLWNAAVIGIALAFQLQRIHQEESVLMQDSEYQAYAARVRYRLIPGIY